MASLPPMVFSSSFVDSKRTPIPSERSKVKAAMSPTASNLVPAAAVSFPRRPSQPPLAPQEVEAALALAASVAASSRTLSSELRRMRTRTRSPTLTTGASTRTRLPRSPRAQEPSRARETGLQVAGPQPKPALQSLKLLRCSMPAIPSPRPMPQLATLPPSSPLSACLFSLSKLRSAAGRSLA